MGSGRDSPRGIAALLACTIARTLRDFPEITLGVWGFDTRLLPVAPFGHYGRDADLLSLGGNLMSAGGGGTDAALAVAALREAHGMPGGGRDLFLLISDGDWRLSEAIRTEVERLVADDGELAVLLVGKDHNGFLESARATIGPERVAALATEDELPDVLEEQLARILV
jgi:uncharacterized protein with von Willebrand factor type A (vWA) domain